LNTHHLALKGFILVFLLDQGAFYLEKLVFKAFSHPESVLELEFSLVELSFEV
jgi:hypothetical protein